MKPSHIIQWVLGACLAAAGLFIFFRSVDLHGLAYQLSHARPLGMVAAAVLSVLSIWLRSLRWSIMLPSPPLSHKKQLFPIVTVAFMINNILPARMGEAARAVLLWRRNGYSAAVSIGSLILERGIDVLALSACFFVPVFFVPDIGGGAGASVYKSVTLHSSAVILAAAVACCVGLLAAYSLFPAIVRSVCKSALALAPRKARPGIRRIGIDVASTLDWTFSIGKILAVVALSAGIVLCYALSVVLLVGDAGFGLLQGLFSQAFAALGAAIPLAPGYVGTLHAVMLEGLVLCGMARDKAQAVTILYHAIPYGTVTLLGLYYFFKLNMTFRDITEAEKKIEQENRGADE
ncbi:MAG TPA: lysylphosphatidylglycerol synthase transmembrane domain-containing protein [Chitinivibrionales bacterium]|nr:lysylphosphatidylglycerol synthase transmembrane domain-containing protein [Chitinivibrionales bacterium]